MTNAARVRRAQKAIASQYRNFPPCLTPGYEHKGKFVAEDVTDILTDIRHLCDKKGYDFATLDRSAYQHYTAEKRK